MFPKSALDYHVLIKQPRSLIPEIATHRVVQARMDFPVLAFPVLDPAVGRRPGYD